MSEPSVDHAPRGFIAVSLSDDLFLGPVIRSACDSAGGELRSMATRAFPETQFDFDVLIADLQSVSAHLNDVLERAHQANALTIGYAPHVRGDLFQAARGAGFDHVLPKSKLQSELPKLLRLVEPPSK
ncbi:hypothetical protein [Stratiformator vulcanicus]|uniref:Response regulatory domain-containing protein n=1 Tax=Stratiformator vulcanicus TaxID=2527980 RepID=A0A517R260_9PLAN|nr:hypothetical protein [Stratiformator vulcanicus]QDT37975.1 hypothetical protein Pan189_23590 [Stratiformator vulcanicus]